jgi:uncharacterized protein YjiS (DUF1127 family)
MTTLLGTDTAARLLPNWSRRDRERPFLARAAMLAGSVLETWLERARHRRVLLQLSDALLEDLGIVHADIWQETRKPFWRA